MSEGNGLLAFTEFVLLPASSLYGGGEFRVDRERDGLEPLIYKDVAQMHSDYQNDIVSTTLRPTFQIFSTNPTAVDPSTSQTCGDKGFECSP